jgi:hypothetical protein
MTDRASVAHVRDKCGEADYKVKLQAPLSHLLSAFCQWQWTKIPITIRAGLRSLLTENRSPVCGIGPSPLDTQTATIDTTAALSISLTPITSNNCDRHIRCAPESLSAFRCLGLR